MLLFRINATSSITLLHVRKSPTVLISNLSHSQDKAMRAIQNVRIIFGKPSKEINDYGQWKWIPIGVLAACHLPRTFLNIFSIELGTAVSLRKASSLPAFCSNQIAERRCRHTLRVSEVSSPLRLRMLPPFSQKHHSFLWQCAFDRVTLNPSSQSSGNQTTGVKSPPSSNQKFHINPTLILVWVLNFFKL